MAVPPKHGGLVTCDLVLKHDVFIDSTIVNLLAEFNYSIGRTLAMAVPVAQSTYASPYGPTGATWVENADNTSDVGLTSTQTGAIITGWTGSTLVGIVADWLVETATYA